MRTGIDASFAGTTTDFDTASLAGVEWVAEYFGGAGAFRVWTNNDRAALAASRIKYRLPIWVPRQDFTSNPTTEAGQALTAAKLLGFRQVIAVDVERDSGATMAWLETFGVTITQEGYALVMYHGGDKEPPSMAHSWLALWTGNPPSSLPEGQAQQYRGPTNAYGMSVDFNVGADDFPLEGLDLALPNSPNKPLAKDDNMYIIVCETPGHADWSVTGPSIKSIPDQAKLSALLASGVPLRRYDQATYLWLTQGWPLTP